MIGERLKAKGLREKILIMDGIILVDKSEGITSFQVCEFLKKRLKLKKIGHGGTLDPFSTGLLIIGVNHATKLLNFFLEEKKEYTGIIELGKETDSYDITGKIVNEKEVNVSEDEIYNAVKNFLGVIEQSPPPFSAAKHKGKPLYKYARKGEIIKKPSRKVFIELFEILNINLPEIEFKIVCSKGTYIRSIAHELGKKLGTYGYLKKLRRTAIGHYRVEQAKKLEDITLKDIIPIYKALNIPSFYLKEEFYKYLKNGNKIRKSYLKNPPEKFTGLSYILCNDVISICSTDNGKIFQPKFIYFAPSH